MTPRSPDEPHVQLGTAALSADWNKTAFVDSLYQWAATLSQSGANYPTILPLKVDKLESGFVISLLKRMGSVSEGTFDSAGDIQASVEPEPTSGKNVLFVRFYEGPASLGGRELPQGADRLDAILDGLPDVGTIMGTMPSALVKAAAAAKAA